MSRPRISEAQQKVLLEVYDLLRKKETSLPNFAKALAEVYAQQRGLRLEGLGEIMRLTFSNAFRDATEYSQDVDASLCLIFEDMFSQKNIDEMDFIKIQAYLSLRMKTIREKERERFAQWLLVQG